MKGWRADAAIHADHSPRSDRAEAPRRRSSSHYHQPPEAAIHIVPFTELLPPWRTVPPDQQSRLSVAPAGTVWCAGDITLLRQRCVAVVGTREVSPDGASRARRLARELTEAGVIVVSGLARGVDTHALSSAVDSSGRVVAVIGTPIDKAYPAENAELQERIYREHLLVSQFAPGSRTFKSNFPERNKLMAALSDATVIVEAGDKSGTLHQATECVRLQRWLFIARSVLTDTRYTWPSTFASYAKMRQLNETTDVLGALAELGA